MRRGSIHLSIACVALGALLDVAWIASRPTPLPHRFLDQATVHIQSYRNLTGMDCHRR